MKRTIRLWILSAAAVWAQPALPLAGLIVDGSGDVWPVVGVTGALRVLEPIASGAIAAAGSPRVVAWKTADQLFLNGESRPAPPGPARFRFDRQGELAEVHYEDTGETLRLTETEAETPTLPEDAVLMGPEWAVVRDPDGRRYAWRWREHDAPRTLLPQVEAP